MNPISRFVLDESGPTSVEYAVMMALIIITCLSSITMVGGEIFNFWDNNRQELESAFTGS